MTEKRFFILKDEEFDVSPCIRDRNSKIDDIYGHYKYDDIEQICLFLNEQNDCISRVGQKIDDYLLEVKYQLEQGTELKDTYVRYGRFKQILLELKGELEL